MNVRDRLISLLGRFLSLLFRTRRLPERIAFERIVILKPCCLGDVLLATPVIAAVQRAFPAARLDFATGAWSRPVLLNNPRGRQVVDTGRVGQGRYDWRDVWRLAQLLRANRYDLCLTLDRSPRVGLAAWLACIPYRAGLDSGGRGFAHNIRVPVPPFRYEPELYLDVARAVSPAAARARFENGRSEFFPSDEDKAAVERLVPQALLVAIHPGGGNNPGMSLPSKRWSPERFAAIAQRLIAEYNATVVLVGAQSDQAITREVHAAMREPTTALIDLTGTLSIGQLGALYQRCTLMIGNDSGVMHLANAVGTPVVALFGPSDPRVYGPYDQKSLALWHEVGCNPCFKHGRARADCCPNHSIDAISVEECWQAVEIVLRRQGVAKRVHE